jgi:hypothetical protein
MKNSAIPSGIDSEILKHKNRNTYLCFFVCAYAMVCYKKALNAQRMIRDFLVCKRAKVTALMLLKRKAKRAINGRRPPAARVENHLLLKQANAEMCKDPLTPCERMKARQEAKQKDDFEKLRQTHKKTKVLLEMYADSSESKPKKSASQLKMKTESCRELLWKLRREHVRRCLDIEAASRLSKFDLAKKTVLESNAKHEKAKLPLFLPLTEIAAILL